VDESSHRNFDIERQVFPSLSNFIESLHDQLWKAYHAVAPHSIEYLQRIQDENKILFLCDSLLQFFKDVNQVEYQARVALIKIVYLYYKSDTIYEQIKIRLATQKKASQTVYFENNSQETIASLV
jgi:hypothetical protein